MRKSPSILASQESIELTQDHWDAINFMREYFAEHLIAPDVRHVIKHLAAGARVEALHAPIRTEFTVIG